MTLDQASSHSIAQLKMLRQAARRLQADNVLAQMNGAYAAFAAVMAKEGKRVFEKMQATLTKAAEQ